MSSREFYLEVFSSIYREDLQSQSSPVVGMASCKEWEFVKLNENDASHALQYAVLSPDKYLLIISLLFSREALHLIIQDLTNINMLYSNLEELTISSERTKIGLM